MEKEKLLLCKLAKVRKMGVEFEFPPWRALFINCCSKSKQIILHMIIYTESNPVNYPIFLGVR